MSSNTRFPRKGEYGSAAGRCQWCSKDDSHFWGMYCSRTCAAAGSFYGFTFATVISLAFALVTIIFFHLFGIVVFVTLSVIFVYYTLAGYKMRRKT